MCGECCGIRGVIFSFVVFDLSNFNPPSRYVQLTTIINDHRAAPAPAPPPVAPVTDSMLMPHCCRYSVPTRAPEAMRRHMPRSPDRSLVGVRVAVMKVTRLVAVIQARHRRKRAKRKGSRRLSDENTQAVQRAVDFVSSFLRTITRSSMR